MIKSTVFPLKNVFCTIKHSLFWLVCAEYCVIGNICTKFRTELFWKIMLNIEYIISRNAFQLKLVTKIFCDLEQKRIFRFFVQMGYTIVYPAQLHLLGSFASCKEPK